MITVIINEIYSKTGFENIMKHIKQFPYLSHFRDQ